MHKSSKHKLTIAKQPSRANAVNLSLPKYNILLLMIFVIVLIQPSQCATDISLQNCPSQYNISQANQTTSSEESFIKSFYAGFSSTSDNARIEHIVVSGDKTALKNYVNQKIIPYAIFGGIVFIVFLILLYYCLFDKSFPPCEKLRRNYLQNPYTTTQKRCMSYWLLILAAIIFSTGIVSFTAIPKMKYHISYTKCAIYNFLDLSINGDSGSGWGGFQSLLYNIGNISSLLDSANTQVNTYLTGDDWLVNNMVVMNNKNMQIYSRNKNAQYISPNPTTTQANLAAKLNYPTVDSVFIKTGLGPNGTFGTMVDDIDRGLRVTQKKGYQAYQIQFAANSMVDNTPTIKTNIVAAQNILNMYLHQLNTTKNETDSLAKQFFDNYFTVSIYVLQGVVGFVLVSSLLVIIGAISTHFYSILQCRFMVHCGWFLYSLMYFGMLVLAFITISMGTVGYYSCMYYNSSMYNDTMYSKIGEAYAQNIFVKLDVCILGDGDVLTKFNIHNQMKIVTDVFTNISTYFDQDSPTSSNYINLNLSTGKISGWIAAMESYRLGIFIDSVPAQRSDDNPNFALSSMNQFSNTVSPCPIDRWVFDATNCTNTSSEHTYQSDATLTNGQNLTLGGGKVICISFNQKLTTGMPTQWTQSDITQRYLQIRQTCSDIYNKTTFYANTLINFRNSRMALFKGIKDQLNDLYTANLNYNTLMNNYRSKVYQFNQAVGTLNNIVANQDTGLLVTSNCAALGKSAKAGYNIFCVNFMYQVVKVGICTILMLITMMAAMCLGSIFGVRYANIQILKRVNADQKEEQIDVHSQVKISKMAFDKQLNLSDRSHSSDEDEKQKEKAKK